MQGGFERLGRPISGSVKDDRLFKSFARDLGQRRRDRDVPLCGRGPQVDAARCRASSRRRGWRTAFEIRGAGPPVAIPSGTHIVTGFQARSVNGPAIVDEAIDRSADGIVMTASVHRKHGRATLGETITHVLLNAPCEVVVIRTVVDPVRSGACHGMNVVIMGSRPRGARSRCCWTTPEITSPSSTPQPRVSSSAGIRWRQRVGTGIDEDVFGTRALRRSTRSSRCPTVTIATSWRLQVARPRFQVPEVVCRIYDPVREDTYRRLGLTTVCPTTTIVGDMLE